MSTNNKSDVDNCFTRNSQSYRTILFKSTAFSTFPTRQHIEGFPINPACRYHFLFSGAPLSLNLPEPRSDNENDLKVINAQLSSPAEEEEENNIDSASALTPKTARQAGGYPLVHTAWNHAGSISYAVSQSLPLAGRGTPPATCHLPVCKWSPLSAGNPQRTVGAPAFSIRGGRGTRNKRDTNDGVHTTASSKRLGCIPRKVNGFWIKEQSNNFDDVGIEGPLLDCVLIWKILVFFVATRNYQCLLGTVFATHSLLSVVKMIDNLHRLWTEFIRRKCFRLTISFYFAWICNSHYNRFLFDYPDPSTEIWIYVPLYAVNLSWGIQV